MRKSLLLVGLDDVAEPIVKQCISLFALLELKDDELMQVFRREVQLSDWQVHMLVRLSKRLNSAVGKKLLVVGRLIACLP